MQSQDRSTRFSSKDVKDPNTLAYKLCGPTDPISRHVREQIAQPTIREFEAALFHRSADEVSSQLLSILNGLLKSPSLYTPAVFAGIPLPAEAKELANRAEGLNSAEQMRLNHLLLQAAFPDEIEAIQGEVSDGPPAPGIIFHMSAKVAPSALRLSDEDKRSLKTVFVPPLDFDRAVALLQGQDLLWVTGPAEAGKRTLALYLAAMHSGRQDIYHVRNADDWPIIADSAVENSVIILEGATYLIDAQWAMSADSMVREEIEDGEVGDDELDGEVAAARGDEMSDDGAAAVATDDDAAEESEDLPHALKRLLGQHNQVIVTSTTEVYCRARNYAPLSACFEQVAPALFALGRESYGRPQRLALIKKAAIFAQELGRIDNRVKEWTLRACEHLEREESQGEMHPILLDWLPGEICTYVVSILPLMKKEEEVQAELKVPLNERIYSWFMELKTESDRFFILTRALFPDLDGRELGKKLREIMSADTLEHYDLRSSDPSVFSYRAAPYIARTSPYGFVNPLIAKAATEVVASCFNHPFHELFPLLRQWSLPAPLDVADGGAVSSDKRKEQERVLKQSAPVRDAVVRMVGRVARYNLASVKELLNCWAKHRLWQIRLSAGNALRFMVADQGNYQDALELVEEWAKKGSDTSRRSAADALWRIIAINPRAPECEQALSLLEYLIKDPNPYIRRAGDYALAQVVQVYPPARVKEALKQLAKDGREEVRAYLASCLAAINRQRDELLTIIKEWIASDELALRRTAILYLVMSWGKRKDEMFLLHEVMREHPVLFEEAAGSMIRLRLRSKNSNRPLFFINLFLKGLAESRDSLANYQAALALAKIAQIAADLNKPKVKSYLHRLLKRWEGSPKDGLRLAALAYRFIASRSMEERRALLSEQLEPLISSPQSSHRAGVAHMLVHLTAQDSEAVYRLMQDWLVTNQSHAVGTVIFYWLLATNCSEAERCRYLSQIFCHFTPSFEEALQQAVGVLDATWLIHVLGHLAQDDRPLVRKEIAMALGQMTVQGNPQVLQALQDWLATDDANTAATVVFYWLAAGEHPQAQRAEYLRKIRDNFPLVYERAMREAAHLWGWDLIGPFIQSTNKAEGQQFDPLPTST